jgi:hypothetical protein
MAVVVNGRGIWGVRPTPSDAWTRSADWLAMPAIGSQEFIGLLAITDDESNHIALLCGGNYTVNWGDGVVENVASGVKAQHTYVYSSISDDTISSIGYKQVLVRVTPQAGQNLTTVNLQQQNNIIAKSYTTGWLDLSINGSNITTLVLGGSTVRQGMCERVTIGNIGTIANFSNLFNSFHSLQSVSLFNTASGTNFSGMFANCYSLQTVPLFNTVSGTNLSSMFQGCGLLSEVPLLNTASGTNFTSMFSGCASIQTAPLLNTASGTNFTSMFQSCTSLQTVPLLNTASGTNFTSMFLQCYSLQTVPLLNTGSGTNLSSMFGSCVTLQTVPLFNTALCANFSSMFSECTSLQSLPNFNTALGTSFGNMLINALTMAKGAFQGTRYAISYSGMCLSKNAVVDIFNGLGTAVGTPTITITTGSGNPAFAAIALNVVPGNAWRGVTIQSSSQDVYASNASTGLVYKQTGGVGPFVSENPGAGAGAWTRGMGTDIYENVYLVIAAGNIIYKKAKNSSSWTSVPLTGIGGGSVISGDYLGNLYIGNTSGLYKQTAGTGSFVQVFTGTCASLSISPFDGSIYVTDGGVTGTIYKQTAGTGSFTAVQNIPYAGGLCCMPNGDVYITNGTLYKQTAGTGSFVSMGILAPGTYGMVNKPDGNLYAVNGDVAYLDFTKVVTPTDRLIATSKGWTIA